MYSQHDLWTRPNTILTHVEVGLGSVPDSDLGGFFAESRRRARQALATAIAVLDERIAARFIAFQILVDTPERVAILDVSEVVRSHGQAVTRPDTVAPALDDLRNAPAPDEATAAALSCYLAALENTLTPPGFMLLIGGLEVACLGVDKHGTGFNMRGLCDELDRLGIPNDRADVGRLIAGPRGEIVHQGFRPHHQLREAWYLAEQLLRAVLQARLGAAHAWPADPPLEPEGVSCEVVRLEDAEEQPGGAQTPWAPVGRD